jgi:hypothetical protein
MDFASQTLDFASQSIQLWNLLTQDAPIHAHSREFVWYCITSGAQTLRRQQRGDSNFYLVDAITNSMNEVVDKVALAAPTLAIAKGKSCGKADCNSLNTKHSRQAGVADAALRVWSN